jgi:hypothetical protein
MPRTTGLVCVLMVTLVESTSWPREFEFRNGRVRVSQSQQQSLCQNTAAYADSMEADLP